MRNAVLIFGFALIIGFVSHVNGDINHNTGSMVLHEELLEAKGHRLSLPLVLNYDSRLKKDQRASWVGLGFELDVPYVERTVQGGPDENSLELSTYLDDLKALLAITGEYVPGGYGDFPRKPEEYRELIEKTGVTDATDLQFVIKSYKPLVEQIDGKWVLNNLIPGNEDFVDLCFDAEYDKVGECNLLEKTSNPSCRYPEGDYTNQHFQDVYTLHNFPSGGGRLFFTSDEATDEPQSLNAAVSPYRPWNISFDGDWVLTDENGIRYHFDKRMQVRNGSNTKWEKIYYQENTVEHEYDLIDRTNDGQEYTWRWYLTKMESYDGESITLEYEKNATDITLEEKPVITDIRKNILDNPDPIFHIDIDLYDDDVYPDVPWYFIFQYKAKEKTDPDSLVFVLERENGYRRLHRTFQVPDVPGYADSDILFTGVKIVIPWTHDPSFDEDNYQTYFASLFSAEDLPEDLKSGIIEWRNNEGWKMVDVGDEFLIYTNGEESFRDITEAISRGLNDPGDLMIDEEGRIADLSNSVGLYGEYDYSGTGSPGKIAFVVEDYDRTILENWYPKRITTSRETVTFGVSSRAADETGPAGRPRLSWMEKTRNGDVVQRVEFNHRLKGVCDKLQLDDLHFSKQGGTRQLLYHFDYKQSPNPAFTEDLFGTELKGFIVRTVERNGEVTDYSYEQGWCTRLSNDSKLPAANQVRCGLRVKELTRSSLEGGGSTVTKAIDYEEGEIPVNDAVLVKTGAADNPLWPGLHKTLAFTRYNGWTGSIPIQLKYIINYGRVKVKTPGAGEVEYEYFNSGDDFAHLGGGEYSLADGDDDRYHLHSMLRNRLKSVTNRDESFNVISREKYVLGAKVKSDLIYKKPATRQREMVPIENNILGSGLDETFCLAYPPESYTSAGFQGTAEAVMIKSVAVTKWSTTRMINGIVSKTEYATNEHGQVTWEQNHKGSDETAAGIHVYYTYGHDIDNRFLAANLYSPVVKRVIAAKSEGEYGNGADTTLKRVSVQPWIINWPGATAPFLPFKNYPFYANGEYVWLSDEDASGTPRKKYNDPTDLQNLPREDWFCTERSTRRSLNKPGLVLEKESNNGENLASVVYRNDLVLPIGQVVNAGYLECGVFTGDYQTQASGTYFDAENAWERGGATLTNTAHLGEKSIHVSGGATGPSRNFRLYPGTDYILSARVRVKQGELELSGSYRYFSKDTESQSQDQLPIKLTVNGISAGQREFGTVPVLVSPTSGWQLVELTIPAKSDISSGDWNNHNWYCRVSIGAVGQDVDALVEDIRFHPTDALVSTTFYDARGRVLCGVDPNNNPGTYAEYDEFDRPIATYKVRVEKDATDEGFLTRLTAKAHHRMSNLAPDEEIRVISPNGGESLTAGTTARIRWLAADDISSVELAYSTDNGKTLTTMGSGNIERGQNSWDNYYWTVPRVVSDQVRVYVRKADETDISDASDEVLSIGDWVDHGGFEGNTLTLPVEKLNDKRIYVKGLLKSAEPVYVYLETKKSGATAEEVDEVVVVEGLGVWTPFTLTANYRGAQLETAELLTNSDGEIEIDDIRVFAQD